MEWAVEWFVLITALAIGSSHILRASDWVEVYGRLHRAGRPGAFINGALSLAPGAALAAGHGVWSWPGVVLTVFGWLLVVKGLVCFLAPDKALRSMALGRSSRSFVVAGVVLLAVGGWAGYCLWLGSPRGAAGP
jgi:hypothetical protein